MKLNFVFIAFNAFLSSAFALQLSPLASDAFFVDYQSYDAIHFQLKKWQIQYPYFVSLNQSIGKSIEGRDIPMIKITNLYNLGPKKAIWLNGGQHAREWISPATVLYLAHKLLTQSSRGDYNVAWLLNSTEFLITPLQNPDGYEYSRSYDRFWRKNRRRNSDGSFGVDLNRNWDEHWGMYGASNYPSDETYMGTRPHSEPEVAAIADWLLRIPNRYAGIDFHSFGQKILRNWGWTITPSLNEALLKELGDGVRNAIYKQSGIVFSSETGASMYAASGCTDDWMTAKAGMVGYTIELPDEGQFGFVLPSKMIIPIGEGIFEGLKFFAAFIVNHQFGPNPVPLS